MTVLNTLLTEGLIESVPTDSVMAGQWVADGDRHLQASTAIAEIDPTGAYVLAYDAARKAIAAVLLAEGYRTKSRPGAHRALARFATGLAGRTEVPDFERFDRLRRNRNKAEYGSLTFGSAEVNDAIATARVIVDACTDLI